jgi:ribonuclease J
MPVHGEWRHLKANAEIAINAGVARENTIVIENGVVVDLVDHVAQVVGGVPCGFVFVDGQSIGDITESSLKDRRILGEEGFISVVVVIDSQSGKIVAGPDIHARGFAEDASLFDEVKIGLFESVFVDLGNITLCSPCRHTLWSNQERYTCYYVWHLSS